MLCDRVDFAGMDAEKAQILQVLAKRAEVFWPDRELQIFVLPRLASQPQIERPSANHVPVQVEPRQPLHQLFGTPGLPAFLRRRAI